MKTTDNFILKKLIMKNLFSIGVFLVGYKFYRVIFFWSEFSGWDFQGRN